jgi:FAD/FMN-containing dehydrogenase
MARLTRRAALLGTGALIGGWASRRFGPNLPLQPATTTIPVSGESILNDASGLNPTPVHKHLVMTQSEKALQDALRAEIIDAKANGRPVNVGAARHSMGGQAIPTGGHALSYDNDAIEPDQDNGVYRVHAGARWSQIIAALDPIGFSPKVMQSNNDFGVAATFCVNAHGWPAPLGPMGSTVRAIELILPSGEAVRASRDENAEIFKLTMGGYGLTGAITAMEVEMVPNRNLLPRFEVMPAKAFGALFEKALQEPDINMAYGRLNVERTALFEEALMITYTPDPDTEVIPPASGSGWMSHAARMIYRAQLGNEPVKRFRWWTETSLGPAIGGGAVTRNSLINEPVVTLDDGDPTRTDILHEYFVPIDQFGGFVDACRQIIPASYQEFLNVTLRYVGADPDSVLAYAPAPRIAAVMSFSQEMTDRAEADMARMTKDLIEAMIGIGGTYYLPYRLHARPQQFTRAYPRASEFAAAKRDLDPERVFRNALWDTYLEAL